jgi:hypothetical protein
MREGKISAPEAVRKTIVSLACGINSGRAIRASCHNEFSLL